MRCARDGTNLLNKPLYIFYIRCVSMVKWQTRSWRASMTDVTEHSAWLYNKTKNVPIQARVIINKRDSGVTDYTTIIQGMTEDDTRGWWMTKTLYSDQGTTKMPSKVIENAEKVLRTLGPLTSITYDDYFDWKENHPIKKHRRVANDWGVYASSRTTAEKGWFDGAYQTISKTNKYATRYGTQAEAKKIADMLTKNNPGWKFEAKQMGKLDK